MPEEALRQGLAAWTHQHQEYFSSFADESLNKRWRPVWDAMNGVLLASEIDDSDAQPALDATKANFYRVDEFIEHLQRTDLTGLDVASVAELLRRAYKPVHMELKHAIDNFVKIADTGDRAQAFEFLLGFQIDVQELLQAIDSAQETLTLLGSGRYLERQLPEKNENGDDVESVRHYEAFLREPTAPQPSSSKSTDRRFQSLGAADDLNDPVVREVLQENGAAVQSQGDGTVTASNMVNRRRDERVAHRRPRKVAEEYEHKARAESDRRRRLDANPVPSQQDAAEQLPEQRDIGHKERRRRDERATDRRPRKVAEEYEHKAREEGRKRR